MMRPLYGRKLAIESEKQRRKSFAGFDLPSTSFDWDDDQIHAYKGARDGLGMDALKAEQYVNTHTPPSKPSGQANLFYKPDAPTAFEQDLYQKLKDRPKPAGMKPDDGPPVQFASQSGHVLGDGEARNPRPATPAISPLFKQTAQLGKQVHNQEQARKITERNGYRVGAKIEAEKPAKPKSKVMKRGLKVKVGDETFEFRNAFTAKELNQSYPLGQAMMQVRPMDTQMALVKGEDGRSLYVDATSEQYKALQKARNIRRAEVINDTSAAVTFAFPEAAPITSVTGGLSGAYLLANDPTWQNTVGVLLGVRGKALLKKKGWSDRAAERGSAATQLINNRLDYGDKD
ncbi:MAG: hypothetical protein ABF335_13345 [Alphaproteobacteria bacterium]